MKGPEDFRERIKVAKKEAKVAKQKIQETAPVDVSDKHPVSALMELCQKRGWQVGVKLFYCHYHIELRMVERANLLVICYTRIGSSINLPTLI